MAYAFVVGASKSSPNANSVTTDAIDTTGVTFIVAHVATLFGNVAPTDSKSNTWNALTGLNDGTAYDRIYWCIPSSVGAGHTFAVSGSANYPGIGVACFTGQAASPFDQETGSTTDGNPGPITPSENDCLIVTGGAIGGTSVPNINSGYSKIANGGNDGLGLSGNIAYLIQTSAASSDPTWDAGTLCTIASFKSAGGGGGTTWPGYVSPWGWN